MSIKRVIIVGGGISGLSTALALHEQAETMGKRLECTVNESGAEWGGKILTRRVQDLIIEGGPDSFLTSKPWALDLCEKLGLTHELINTNQAHSQTFTYSRGRLREFPQGLVTFVPTRLGPLFKNGLISWPGIIRMAGDWVLPAKRDHHQDESLATFFRRRLGKEAFDRLIEPLVAGIYAGNAEELSLAATFPRFRDLEIQYGGLIKGMLAQRKSPNRSRPTAVPQRTTFTTLKGGLGDLIATLRKKLDSQNTHFLGKTTVTGLKPTTSQSGAIQYEVMMDTARSLSADAVVLATPAYSSAKLISPIQSAAGELLNLIPYASTATISLAFPREAVQPLLHGFGFVVPRVEGKTLIAATWTSLKWSHRAPPEHSLIRCYVGGRGRESILALNDEQLVKGILDELRIMVGIQDKPFFIEIHRWDRGMPQYTLGHLQRLKEIRRLLEPYPGLVLTGAAYEGVGIPDCIHQAYQTAENMASYFWPNVN